MEIRSCNITDPDKQSAKIFFDALHSFYSFGSEGLDMFARDGTLTVSQYAYKVENLDVWELNEEHRAKLQDFRPRDLVIGDSYKTLDACARRYDLVVVDSPQGLHKDSAGHTHAEHFDVMKRIHRILKDDALIVLYVNKRPYDRDKTGSHGYDHYDEYNFRQWMDARMAFYQGGPQAVTEESALAAYRRTLHRTGYTIRSSLVMPCHSDVEGLEPYAFRVGLQVRKVR